MRWMWGVTLGFLFLGSSVQAGAVRECTAEQVKTADDGYSPPDDQGRRFYHRDTKSHRLFHLEPAVYSRPIEGGPNGTVSVVVSTDGRVECLDAKRGWPLKLFRLTPERRALLRDMKNWRFEPFLVDGKPVRALDSVWIPERIDFHFHEDMPYVPLLSSTLTLSRGGAALAPLPQYTVTLYGDGDADFESTGATDAVGHYRYKISPGEVAALIERLRSKDVWSAAGNWYALVTDSADNTLTLHFGGQSRVIRDHVGEAVGMPRAVSEAEVDIDTTARATDLVHLTMAGVSILDENHFAFKSNAGADLLMRSIFDRDASDEAIVALLDRGAPIEGGKAEGWLLPRPLPVTAVDAALITGRRPVALRLIADGALSSDGRPDPTRIERAWKAALKGGDDRLVQAVRALRPD